MFKLESYITPILLSYVDKYIKNFRPEDSQFSLWGGDVSFLNLDLRLEVLEQELQLPFSFVSGHIHELLIHVPWTKITSEPITITINTIECILKLKSASSGSNFDASHGKDKSKKLSHKKDEIEAPPGYVHSLINKIVNNIKIYCNNLILKYVEEDIVLSMNIKLLTFESANEDWKSGYIDVSQNKVTLRKLINVSDLTICLDKRNAAGKIDVYQEPVLYRCSLTLYMLRYYHSATSKRPTTTRLDIFCDCLEFSATETQIPMLMRIYKLINALASKELKPETGKRDSTAFSGDCEEASFSDKQDNLESWASWAWSFIPSLGSVDEENDENMSIYAGHTMQIGVYVDIISIKFKVSEQQSDKGYYGQSRIKYWPLLSLFLQGVYVDTVMHEMKWSRTSLGVSEIVLFPVGSCSCSHVEIQENSVPPKYFKAGVACQLYKDDSLFDPEAAENKGIRRSYENLEWEYHLNTVTEAVLLERTPAFAFDLINQIEIPDDTSSEVLLELSNNRENSNFPEKTMLRIVFGPFILKLCSGFLHRVSSLLEASKAYDYAPYSVAKPDPLFSELPPPSADDYDALNENISTKTMQITLLAPVVQVHLLDHPHFVPRKGFLFKRKKLSPSSPQTIATYPHLSFECQCIDITIKNPMYEKRLIVTTSQLPEPPQHMFEACYQTMGAKILGFQTKVVLDSKKHNILIPPTSIALDHKKILKPQYWNNPNVIREVFLIESENVSIAGTKAKLFLATFIITSFLKWQKEKQQNIKSILNTSLLKDSSKENGMIYAELSIENVRLKKVLTSSTISIDSSLDSIKGFVFEQVDFETKGGENVSTSPKKVRFADIQQVMFVSGPECDELEVNEDFKKPCFSITLQFPISPDKQVHAPLCMFHMQEITFCCDPLLLKWLSYIPKRTHTKVEVVAETSLRKSKTISDTSSNLETSRKLTTTHESVHSSSDREHVPLVPSLPNETKDNSIVDKVEMLDFLKHWSNIWACSLVCGHIEQCTVYFPMTSLSAIGSQNIKQAVLKNLKRKDPPELLVLVSPEISLKSSINYQTLSRYIKALPIDTPSNVWSEGKSSFPWYISAENFQCYSLQKSRHLDIIKSLSFDITIGFTAKSKFLGSESNTGSKEYEASRSVPKNRLEYVINVNNSDKENKEADDMQALNICIHFDMKPVVISLSEVQVCLITNITYGFLEKLNLRIDQTAEIKVPEIVPYFSEASTDSPFLPESTVDSTSEQVVLLEKSSNKENNGDWSAWIQWTVARVTLELLAYDAIDLYSDDISYDQPPNMKLSFDFEDIVTSFDYQGVYLKIKSKIASASILHFKRTGNSKSWKPGSLLGILLRQRDTNVEKIKESSDFFSLTLTRASCKHTHALWGTKAKSKSKKKIEDETIQEEENTKFITEIDVSVLPMDIILPFTILRDFYMVLEPFLSLPQSTSNPNDNWLINFNNQTLPLIYLHMEGVRVIIPSAELSGKEIVQNVCVFQIDNISVSPNAVNPIIRTPCRPDIYQQGVRSHKINIPGSDLEDRQFQLDVVGISCSTCLWEDLVTIFNNDAKENNLLKTMSENPALEWNNLGKNVLKPVPELTFWPIIKKFDVSVMFAPAMVYKLNTIVCGHSLEINFVSDIEVVISVNQISLLWVLMNEYNCIWKSFMLTDLLLKRPQVFINTDKEKIMDIPEVLEQVKDSGIETSEKRSNISLFAVENSEFYNKPEREKKPVEKSFRNLTHNYWPMRKENVPVELLVVTGKITISFYDINNPLAKDKLRKGLKKPLLIDADNEKGYEGSEEGSENLDLTSNNFLPLVFFHFYQPSFFVSMQQVNSKTQISISDMKLKTSSSSYKPLSHIPKEENFPIDLLDTRAGMPHPDTGILPLFFTLKLTKSLGKDASLDVEFGKPLKLEVSIQQWYYFLTIRDKLINIFQSSFDNTSELPFNNDPLQKSDDLKASCIHPVHKKTDLYTKLVWLKETTFGVSNIDLKMSQLVLFMKTSSGNDGVLTIGLLKLYLSITNRPERVNHVIKIENVTFSTIDNDRYLTLLNPCQLSLECCLFWEPWQTSSSNPQVQISLESDNIHFNIGTKHLNCLRVLSKDIQEILAYYLNETQKDNAVFDDSKSNPESIKFSTSEREQHYRDDLRAGAFQFVDASSSSSDELPLPYQVMFWNKGIAAMAWRYPQPRVLTKVRVFPVPFVEASGKYKDEQVLCSLEYWADFYSSYQPYTQFYLSESEMCHVDLPKNKSYPTVSCIWRVVLHPINYQSSRGLEVADLEKFLISPKALAACLRIDSYFCRNLVPDVTVAVNVESMSCSFYSHLDKDVTYRMPQILKEYTFDGNIPEDQCFATIYIDNSKMYVLSRNFEDYQIDLSFSTKCSVLEYSFLTLQTLFEPFRLKIELDLTRDSKINVLSQPITIKYGPPIGHTLAVNLQMWNQTLDESTTKELVILTNYVVCNDTNLNIVFGQDNTDEKILLSSRNFHMYCWRSPRYERMLRVTSENFDWNWSSPFYVNEEGTKVVEVNQDHQFFVTVDKLSATQTKIIITGNLVLCNMLTEHFEYKVFENVDNDKDRYKKARTHILEGRNVAPSILLMCNQRYCLRLRFFGMDSAWTGNIPLEINLRNAQPWLVKVPFQERNTFLSIWCKVITQKFGKHVKYLTVLWPLFMIKSNLPINAQCKIETPSLMLSSNCVVKGKGKYQQLYCPGTSDHSHLLSFHFDNGIPAFNSVVPINYTLVEQKTIFKKHDNEDICKVLDVLTTLENEKWPYFGEELSEDNYIVENQPVTHVKVNYKEVCPYSSCLLIELIPWCIFMNNLGCSIGIIVDNEEVCTVKNQGVISPPKIEGDFYLSLDVGKKKCLSNALQLANSDWSQTFYMPRIIGTVPLNGTIQTPIKCGAYVSMVSITSNIYNDMRQLRVTSSHILVSCISYQLEVVCFAVPNNENVYSFPKNVEKFVFTIAPNLNKSEKGVSILRWYLVDGEINTDYALYISFAINSTLGWSCPVRVDKGSLRRPICVKSQDQNIPLVITCQEYKKVTYISVHHDKYPQLQIVNKSGKKLFFAQNSRNESTTNGCLFVRDSVNFDWLASAENNETIFYSLPSFSERFPDLASDTDLDKLIIAAERDGDKVPNRWSAPININIYNDHFVRIPRFKDVKVTFTSSARTTFVTIDSISQAEVSAKDIRIRLALHEKQHHSETTKRALKSSKEFMNVGLIDDRDIYFSKNVKDNRISSNSSVLTSSNKLESSTNPSSKLLVCTNNHTFILQTYLKGVTFTFTSDLDTSFEIREIVNVICEDIVFVLKEKEVVNVTLSISEIQIDNQMYTRGGYDFPVVLVSQSPRENSQIFSLNETIEKFLTEFEEDAFVKVDVVLEKWIDPVLGKCRTDIDKISVSIKPLSAYIEDVFVLKLKEYFTTSLPTNLVIWPHHKRSLINHSSNFVNLPSHIVLESIVLASPITVRSLIVQQWSLLLSVHSSIKIYIALDQSPLQFSKFEHRNVMTTSYRLGYAFTLHYLSGAIFGAGWVVGSLELLGSPGTLARAMGSGLKDFVSLPYMGLIQGPWAFIRGITNGSASLMRHVTAGTVQSVTKLAASVARNLDRLTLDEEHFQRTEATRRQRPHGVTQGLIQGLTGFGISLLGAVGGIAHHPLRSIMTEGASPKGLATGVGMGLVGMITKPLSGAADLIAQTGEGFLQGAGWNTFREPKIRPVLQHILSSSNSVMKYNWKLSRDLTNCPIIFATEVTVIRENNIYDAKALILHSDILLIINTADDVVEQNLTVKDVEIISDCNDPTSLTIKVLPPKKQPIKILEDDVPEMDPAQRARVADYVKNTTGLIQFPDDVSLNNSEMSISSCNSPSRVMIDVKEECKMLLFYVNPRSRNYFVSLFYLTKEKQENFSFQFS